MKFDLISARWLIKICLWLWKKFPEQIGAKVSVLHIWEPNAKEKTMQNNEQEQEWIAIEIEILQKQKTFIEKVLNEWL